MRKPMVTRTEIFYDVVFTVVDMETKTVKTKKTTIPAILCKGKEPTIEDVKSQYVTATKDIPVAIDSVNKNEILLGMYEEDFICKAMLLDNETRKPIE